MLSIPLSDLLLLLLLLVFEMLSLIVKQLLLSLSASFSITSNYNYLVDFSFTSLFEFGVDWSCGELVCGCFALLITVKTSTKMIETMAMTEATDTVIIMSVLLVFYVELRNTHSCEVEFNV